MDVLYLDSSILVLNKPAGLPVLPGGWDPSAPFVLALAQADHGRLWVVHRLDKVTTGVLVLARTADAHRHLNGQFERREVHKIYHAIVNGLPSWEFKESRQPLRANVGHRHRTSVDHRLGKPSATTFKVIGRYQAHALLEAQPRTGRPHQVRAHASALGFPLLGDAQYGAPATLLIQRPALHAFSLMFKHPDSDRLMTFNAKYPADFEHALGSLGAGGLRARPDARRTAK